MKILLLNEIPVKIRSSDEIKKWDSNFQKDLYEFCYSLIPEQGEYKPYIDVDRFNQNNDSSLDPYSFCISEKLIFHGEKLQRQKEEVGDKCDCPELFINQMVIRNRLFTKFPEMVGLFNNICLLAPHQIDNLKVILKFEKINITNIGEVLRTNSLIYERLWTRDKKKSEDQSGNSVVGKLTEEVFRDLFDLIKHKDFFKVNNQKVSSYGDFVLMCLPNNLWISVKSNKTRERLLSSGFSTDIIGIGKFNEVKEFTDIKIMNLKKVGFLAIYLPDFPLNEEQSNTNSTTYDLYRQKIELEGKDMPINFNGRPFIRKTTELINDLQGLLKVENIKDRDTINF